MGSFENNLVSKAVLKEIRGQPATTHSAFIATTTP
jgi:hypothetical protein